jgi:hypothetical protein
LSHGLRRFSQGRGGLRKYLAYCHLTGNRKRGKSFDYYDAVGPKAHEIFAEKGVEVSNTSYFSYETFRVQGHFFVVATALPESGMRGKIIYESKTGKWAGTEDMRQGLLR